MRVADTRDEVNPGRGNTARARIQRQKHVCHVKETSRRPAGLEESEGEGRVVGAVVRGVMGQPSGACEKELGLGPTKWF